MQTAVLMLASTVAMVGVTDVSAQGVKDKPRAKPAVADTKPVTVAAPSKHAADEAAIRKSGDSYTQAYAKGDAKSVAAHFTEEAEYVDESGEVTHGRAKILEELVEHFKQTPGAKLAIEIESIRFVAPGVAIEDGISRHTHEGEPEPLVNLYTAVHVKVDGKWLVASVRDMAPVVEPSAGDRLKDLKWLVGDWIDEDEESVTKFSCQPSADGNFLLREFTILMEGQKVLTGTQRITWDPKLGQFRSWSFDSDGGFAEGVWHVDGERWVVKSTGQTAAGESATMTNTYLVENDHTLEFETAEFVINGEPQEVTNAVTLVRAPLPPGGKK